MQINGHGVGDSFLSVVAGQGTYLENQKGNDQTLGLGSMLTIDKDTEVSLTNTATSDLHAFLLSITPPESDLPKRAAASGLPRQATANG